MKTCCFCFDLKHGSNASATFTLVTRIIGVAAFAILLWNAHRQYEEKVLYYSNQENVLSHDYSADIYLLDVLFGVAIGECALIAIFSVMLLIGIKKNIKCLFWPWIIITGIEIAGAAFLLVRCLINITLEAVIYQFIGTLVAGAFYSYMFWCVLAYYKSLSATVNLPYQHFSSQSNQISDEVVPTYKMEKEKDTTRLV